MVDIQLFDDLPSIDSSWIKWKKMMFDEGWSNAVSGKIKIKLFIDRLEQSIQELAPTLSTTKSVAAKDKEGNTLSHLSYCEYDGLTNVSTFLTDKEYRGKGIGAKVWQRAMDRIDQDNTIMMLKSVPELTNFYKKWGFVVEGSKNYAYSAPWKAFLDTFQPISKGVDDIVQPITPELFPKWIEFDRMVTGKDRKNYLEKYFALDYTYTFCILDENSNISGTISIVPTPHKEKVLYKVSTLYTSSLTNAAALLTRAVLEVSNLNKDAHISFTISEGSRGFIELDSILSKNKDINRYFACVLLTSKLYKNPVDINKLYISGNSDCHYDA